MNGSRKAAAASWAAAFAEADMVRDGCRDEGYQMEMGRGMMVDGMGRDAGRIISRAGSRKARSSERGGRDSECAHSVKK